MKGIPMIPMLKVLKNFAAANNIPLKATSYESIIRCFNIYQIRTANKN